MNVLCLDVEIFSGYGTKKEEAVYRTSNSDYGRIPPNVHTMPTAFHGVQEGFTKVGSILLDIVITIYITQNNRPSM